MQLFWISRWKPKDSAKTHNLVGHLRSSTKHHSFKVTSSQPTNHNSSQRTNHHRLPNPNIYNWPSIMSRPNIIRCPRSPQNRITRCLHNSPFTKYHTLSPDSSPNSVTLMRHNRCTSSTKLIQKAKMISSFMLKSLNLTLNMIRFVSKKNIDKIYRDRLKWKSKSSAKSRLTYQRVSMAVLMSPHRQVRHPWGADSVRTWPRCQINSIQ